MAFPMPRWLLEYQRPWLLQDLVAGVTLAAYAIPVSIAYASLAGLPGQAGIYCYLLGGIGYAWFGGSRQLAIGPTAAISMAVGAALARLAADDPARIPELAALTAMLVAAMGFAGWLLRFSQLVNFVSETALLGFKAGAALSIAMTQLPKLFGVPGGGHSFFQRIHELWLQLGGTHPATLLFGLTALLVLWAGDKFLPGRPLALFVVAASLLAVSFTGLGGQGIKVAGELPQGLPTFRLPRLGFDETLELIPLAFACLLLSYVESVSAGRAFAQAHAYRVEPRRELLAIGVANLCAGLGQGYPVAGGLSQSAVNDKAGAQTPAALLWASLVIGIVLMFLAGWFRNLPETVLAAIVLVAVKGLVDLRELAHVWRVSRFDFHVAMAALVGVLLLGILKGILLASILSLLLLLNRIAHPHVAFLGRIPGTERFTDTARHPDNEAVAGMLIFRVEASILYFNAEHVENAVLDRLARPAGPFQWAVCDLSSSPYLDLVGARMLLRLEQQLSVRGCRLRIVNARANVRDLLRAEGLEERVGKIGRRETVPSVVREYLAGTL